MLNIYQKLNKIRPKPFKFLQRQLGIEEEWSTFKVLMKPHKIKVLAVGFLAIYPIYQGIVNRYYASLHQKVQEQLQETKPLSKILENFVKQLVESALKDSQIKRESAIFGENIVKKQEALDSVLALLLDGVKDPHFIHESKALAKTLGMGVIRDKVIERKSIDFVLNIIKDPEVKFEILESGKYAIRDDSTKKELIDMCKNMVYEGDMQAAMKEVLSKACYDVVTDKATAEKLKQFAIYLLENEAENLKESAQGFISNIATKVTDKATKGS